MNLHIESMTCGGCVKGVTQALQRLDAQAAVDADLASRRVRVRTDLPMAQVLAALASAGYPAVDAGAATHADAAAPDPTSAASEARGAAR